MGLKENPCSRRANLKRRLSQTLALCGWTWLDFIGSSQSSCMSLFFNAQQGKRPEVTGIFYRLIPYLIEWKWKKKKPCSHKLLLKEFFLLFSHFSNIIHLANANGSARCTQTRPCRPLFIKFCLLLLSRAESRLFVLGSWSWVDLAIINETEKNWKALGRLPCCDCDEICANGTLRNSLGQMTNGWTCSLEAYIKVASIVYTQHRQMLVFSSSFSTPERQSIPNSRLFLQSFWSFQTSSHF